MPLRQPAGVRDNELLTGKSISGQVFLGRMAGLFLGAIGACGAD